MKLCVALHSTLLTKAVLGGVGGERRQLLDKIKRPLFVPDNKRPHLLELLHSCSQIGFHF